MKSIESPFVGLVPYDTESRRYFCGRDQETDLITANASSSRLTVFYGLSGAGKSSILCAGLIPWLQETRKTLESAQTLAPFRALPVLLREQWSLDPWAELCKGVDKAIKAWPQYSGGAFPGAWFSPAERTSSPRSSEVPLRGHAGVPKLVLILDQFEELFIQHPDLVNAPSNRLLKLASQLRAGEQPQDASPGQLMAACLIALLNDPAAPVNIIFSLREDCLASLDVFKGLIPDLFGTMLRIEPLDGDGVRCVITESLKRWGEDHGGNPGAFRPEEPNPETKPPHEGLIPEIVNDQDLWVRDPARSDRKEGVRRRYETPFLQIVLERLWREDIGPDKASSGGMLTIATYQRLGGASGIRRSFVDASLDRHLAYQPNQQRWFLEATRYLVSRTQKFPWRVSDLVEEIKPALERDQMPAPSVMEMTALLELFLIDKIIRELPHEGPEDPRFEVAHDALAGDIYRWRVGQFAILDTKRNEEARLVELKRQEKEQEERQRIQQDEEAKAAKRIAVLKFAFDRLAKFSAVLMLCLLMVAGLLLYQAYRARIEANEAKIEANEARAKANEATASAQKAEQRARLAENGAKAADRFAQKWKDTAEELGKVSAKAAELERLNQQLVTNIASVEHSVTAKTGVQEAVANLQTTANSLQSIVTQTAQQVDVASSAVKEVTSILRLPAATVLPDQPDRICAVQFLATTPPLLATGSMAPKTDGTTRLFGMDGTLIKELPGDCGVMRGSPDGNWLLTLPLGSNVFHVYKRQKDWQRFELDGGAPINGSCAAFSPDSRWLALGWGSSIQIWDWRSPPSSVWAWRNNTALPSFPTSVAFSADGRKFVTGCDDNFFAVFQFPTEPADFENITLWRKETVHAPLRVPVFSADGKWLLAPNGGSSVWLYPADKSDSRPIELTHSSNVIAASFSPDSRWIAALTVDQKVSIWKLTSSGNPFASPASVGGGHAGTPRILAWRSDSGALATAGDDGAVLIWDASTFGAKNAITAAKDLRGHRKAIHAMQYSPDGRFLASGDDSGMVRLWDFQDMRAWQRGRVLTFGGPTDTDHSPDEGLALASNWHEADDLAIKVFPANADRASSPKVCQLDTKSYYIAMRWDYKLTPAAWLRSHPVRVMNLRTGLEMEAQPVDWGPSLSTGALMHLSPALAAALNVKPNDEAAAWVPVPIDVSKAATPK